VERQFTSAHVHGEAMTVRGRILGCAINDYIGSADREINHDAA
jgi:hypothetical protein